LANAIRKYYGYVNLYLMASINGHIESLVNPVWNAEMTAAKEGFTAKMGSQTRPSWTSSSAA
jgi:hypothetical protein